MVGRTCVLAEKRVMTTSKGRSYGLLLAGGVVHKSDRDETTFNFFQRVIGAAEPEERPTIGEALGWLMSLTTRSDFGRMFRARTASATNKEEEEGPQV